MRKNGVNKELRPVAGGVCAVKGFLASGVACGIRADGTEDLGLIFAERKCPTAGVYSTCKRLGAPVEVTKAHLKKGYAQAILVNGGVANVYFTDGVRLAEQACRLLEKPVGVCAADTAIASTGRIGEKISLTAFEKGVPLLCAALTDTASGNKAFVNAIGGEEGVANSCAYSFSLGDFTGTIGAAFKGSLYASPNMATTLVFLTTDVNISSEMLQHALSTEVRETLNSLHTGDAQSPNDTVCMMASGRLGNYRIDCEDTEYKKFCLALRGVLMEICRQIVKGEQGEQLTCKVTGARSKQLARAIAKSVVGLHGLKSAIQRRQTGLEDILNAAMDCGADLNGLRVVYATAKTEVTVFDEGLALHCTQDILKGVFDGEEIEIRISVGEGNFSAVALGRL